MNLIFSTPSLFLLCLRLFGTKCAKCAQGFTKNDFVMRARNKIYHIDCFRCVACSRQLIPGDEFALREDGLFCKADHEVMERPIDRDQPPNVNHRNYINGEYRPETWGVSQNCALIYALKNVESQIGFSVIFDHISQS